MTCGTTLDAVLGCAVCLWDHALAGDAGAADELPRIEGYQIFEELGHGGMGVVYRARQEVPEREVALKIVAPGSLRASVERRRFQREVAAMAAMTHPGILPLYETGEDAAGRSWFTMLLAGGGTLAERAKDFHGNWQRTAELVATLAQAVQYAHERGILHRDLKPANVLFDTEQRAYVADFGLAKWGDADSGLTNTTHVMGSPAYMAPEVVEGGTHATTTISDVYGLGTILYELLTGQRPYADGNAAQVLARIIAEPPVSPRLRMREIPRDLEVITQKAMAREPERRYASAAALAADLTLWLENRPILARPVGPLERGCIWARRNPALAALSAMLLVSFIAGGALLWRANQKLTASLADAEARVDFMARELPLSLGPLGRLDLLDGVFENVAEHYRMERPSDAAGLAREADFLTQWAQILRPRGQTLAAVEKLTLAMAKARAASDERDPTPEIVRTRINTERRLAEALIEARRFDEARTLLTDATAYATAHPSMEISQRLLEADVEMEKCFLEWGRGELKEAAPHGERALRLRLEMLPLLEKPPVTPEHQAVLLAVLQNWDSLSQIYRTLGNTGDEKRCLDGFSVLASRLSAAMPANSDFQFQYLLNRLRLGQEPGADAGDGRKELLEADAVAERLISRDPGNMIWLAAAAHGASALLDLSEKNQDLISQLAWRSTLAARLDTIYRSYSSDLRHLEEVRELAIACAGKFNADDWPTARHHFEAALRLQKRIYQLTNSEKEAKRLKLATNRIYERVVEKEGQPAADAWRAAFESSLLNF